MPYYPQFTFPDPSEPPFPGVSSNALEALGEVAASFEDLDAQVGAAISFLLRRGESVGQIVTAELSFRNKLNLYGALFRVEAPRSLDFDRLQELIGCCFQAEEKRNVVLHSKWRRSLEGEGVIRTKYDARHKHGLRQQSETLTPAQIQSLGLHCYYLAACVDELMFAEFGNAYGL